MGMGGREGRSSERGVFFCVVKSRRKIAVAAVTPPSRRAELVPQCPLALHA